MRLILWWVGFFLLITACVFGINAVIVGANGEIGWAIILTAGVIGLTVIGHMLWRRRASLAS